MIAESHPDRSVAFRVARHQYRLSGREVLDRARQALDWVYLCLTFELHDEGWRLFTLIDPSQVSKTLYERTNRFAQACRIRAEVQM